MKFSIFILALAALFGVGCQTTAGNPTLDQKIQAETRADTPEAIAERAAQTFSSASGLNDEQRDKLNKLYLKTYAESWQIRKEIGLKK